MCEIHTKASEIHAIHTLTLDERNENPSVSMGRRGAREGVVARGWLEPVEESCNIPIPYWEDENKPT